MLPWQMCPTKLLKTLKKGVRKECNKKRYNQWVKVMEYNPSYQKQDKRILDKSPSEHRSHYHQFESLFQVLRPVMLRFLELKKLPKN
jgi:hypothetical protein